MTDLTVIGGSIVAIVVLSQVAQTLLGDLMRKSSNNNRKVLSQAEHEILVHLTEFKLVQKEIVEKMHLVVCDQRKLTDAVQKLADHCERIAAGMTGR